MTQLRIDVKTWWCLPGGGVEQGETPAQAALRELEEECCVRGVIIRQTSHNMYAELGDTITYLVDIGDQIPSLGYDPEVEAGTQKRALFDVQWLSLSEIPERDRAFVWAAGLLGIDTFLEKVFDWGNRISYPDRDHKRE